MKLSKEQERVFKNIQDDIKLAKECNTFKEYYIREHTDDFKDRSDFQSILEYETKMFEENEELLTNQYIEYWKDAREHNITLTICSSATLKALEKRNLIKIIKDGKQWVDRVQLLESEMNK